MVVEDHERFLSRGRLARAIADAGLSGDAITRARPGRFLSLPLAARWTSTAEGPSVLEPHPRPDGADEREGVIPVVGPNEDAGRAPAPLDDEAAAALADESGPHRQAGANLPFADASLRAKGRALANDQEPLRRQGDDTADRRDEMGDGLSPVRVARSLLSTVSASPPRSVVDEFIQASVAVQCAGSNK